MKGNTCVSLTCYAHHKRADVLKAHTSMHTSHTHVCRPTHLHAHTHVYRPMHTSHYAHFTHMYADPRTFTRTHMYTDPCTLHTMHTSHTHVCRPMHTSHTHVQITCTSVYMKNSNTKTTTKSAPSQKGCPGSRYGRRPGRGHPTA